MASEPRNRQGTKRTNTGRRTTKGGAARSAEARREEARRRYLLEKKRKLRRKRLRRKRIKRVMLVFIPVLLVFLGCYFVSKMRSDSKKTDSDGALLEYQGLEPEKFAEHPNWTEDFLTKNQYSRPGYNLPEVKNIFVHYVANPGTSAKQNRDYFDSLGESGERSASAHFIINLDGQIIQCVPLNEVAYAVVDRNYDSISIECCHPDEEGKFTQETYDSLLKLLRWLLDVYDLSCQDVLRHYDSNGKMCPLYYVEHEDAWEQLKADI